MRFSPICCGVCCARLPRRGRQPSAYAIEDHPPAGWTVYGISDGGQFDPVAGKVNWGPFFDAGARALTYQVSPPPRTTGRALFSGASSADGESLAIGGCDEVLETCQLLFATDPASGQMRFTLQGRAGARFLFETSTDLLTWTVCADLSNPDGVLHFAVPVRTDIPGQFFRVRLVEESLSN